MNGPSLLELAAFLAALGGAALLTPASILLARRCGVLDAPDPRKVHAEPTPRWGGMAIFGGVLGALFLVSFLPAFQALLNHTRGPWDLRRQWTGILVAASVAWFWGTLDDRRGLPPLTKLLAQIIAAYVAMVYGVRMGGVSLPGLGYVVFPLWLSQVVTFLWLIGFMNVVNLADGLDGLAAGICAIASGTFVVVCLLQAETGAAFYSSQLRLAAVLSSAISGACLGFLIYNFPPARVFMGDGGALFLGFMLGAVSLIGTLKTGALISLVIPLLAVALPVTDTAFAVFRRWRSRRGLMEADRGHFHHRLLAWGWTAREVSLLAYVITLLFSAATLCLALFSGRG